MRVFVWGALGSACTSSYGRAGVRTAASRMCCQMSHLTELWLPEVPLSAPQVPIGPPVPIPNDTRIATHLQGRSHPHSKW